MDGLSMGVLSFAICDLRFDGPRDVPARSRHEREKASNKIARSAVFDTAVTGDRSRSNANGTALRLANRKLQIQNYTHAALATGL